MIETAALKQAVGDLDEDLVMSLLDEFIESNPGEQETQSVVAACQEGMDIVGEYFEEGEYFVGDLIFAGELLSTAIDKLKPLLGNAETNVVGTLVLGTVEGDIHDIGKNIFRSMCEAAGFRVIDLGIDQPPEAFVKAVKENKPEIVGFSGVLTLSIDSMKRTCAALDEAGVRDGLKVTIGGNAVSAEACEFIGADYWSKNAAEAVKHCRKWVGA